MAAAEGCDAGEMERRARVAASDKRAAFIPGADDATRTYAAWLLYAVTKLGVTGESAHKAASAATAPGTQNQALAAEQAAGVQGEFTRQQFLQTQRDEAYSRAQRECPFPVVTGPVYLPGGLQLMNDEFLVSSGRDWGFSSQQILITTHRAIWSHGRVNQQQNALYLTDIRDVVFRKPLIGFGSLAFETSSGHVIEALPSISNGAQVRNALLALIHYARNRTQQPR
jgi:hypothetical protein